MPNPLTMQGAPQAAPMSGIAAQRRRPSAPQGMMKAMELQHSQSRAMLNKLEEDEARAKVVRKQFEHLRTLGDLVSPEDIIDSATKVVAAGVAPMNVATLLADMPQQSEALVAWVAGQEKSFAQKEQQLSQVLGQVRHQTGLAALRLLAADSFTDAGLTPGGMPQANLMAPQGPSLGPEAPPMQSLTPGNELMGDFDAS